MSITQGSPLPDITTTETRQDVAPSYYTDYLTGLSGAGAKALERTPEAGIAGYDPLQELGYGLYGDAAGAYLPGLAEAEKTLGRGAAGVTGARVSELMNPYTREVVDEMARLQQQGMQRSMLPTLKAGFVGSGALGSQRYAGALGQALAESQRNLTGQQSEALRQGYNEAMRTALGELPFITSAGQQQAQAARLAQELGLEGVGALTRAGAERQAYQQSLLDYPLKTATSVSGLMRGYQVPMTQEATKVGPGQRGQYEQSDLSKLLSVLSLVGAAGGGDKSLIGAGGKTILDFGKWLAGQIGSGEAGQFFPTEPFNDATYSGGGIFDDSIYYNDPNKTGA